MSIHKSLKLKNTLVRARSVLTRWERIEKLKEQERWSDGDSVLGLPKVRTQFKVRSRKSEKREEAEARDAEAEEKTEFNVELKAIGAQKIQVIKAVRAATGATTGNSSSDSGMTCNSIPTARRLACLSRCTPKLSMTR